MALLLIDGFNSYTSVNELFSNDIAVGAAPPFFSTSTKKDGYQSLAFAINDNVWVDLTGNTNRIYVSFWFRFDTSQTSNTPIAYLGSSSSLSHCSLRFRSDHKLELRGANWIDLSLVSAQALSVDTWYHIELVMKNTASSVTGDFVLKVDGTQWLATAGGDDLRYSTYTDAGTFFMYGPSAVAGNFYWDNLVLWDGSGSGDFSDAFMGQLRIAYLEPNGNGNTNNFVGQDADSVDNYLNVDENTHDTDTTYNESSTLNHKDLYAFDNMSGSIDSIHAVRVGMFVKKDTDTKRGVKCMTRVNGSEYLGTEKWLANGTYVFLTHTWELNPDDSLAWEEADVNGAEFGLQITT